jgi:hypothetical protein
MQTLKDTATLAILILLAMTFRVDLGGEAVALDLSTPAEASVEQTPVTPQPIEEPVARPASTCSGSATTRQIRRLSIPRVEVEGADTEQPRLVWENEGRRIVIVLGDEESVLEVPEPEVTTRSCEETIRAHLSS